MVSSTDRILPKEVPAQGVITDEEDAEEVPEVKIMEEQATFDQVIVWGHETLPDETADPYVRGMEEWIAFAEHVCSLRYFWIAEADYGRFIRTHRMRRHKRQV